MRVAFCCDAGPAIGIGHVMRCLALAEELAARGATPVFVADLAGVPWARAQVERRGFAVVAPETTYVDGVLACAPSAVVLDSYLLPAEVSGELRAAGLPVLAIVDGDLRGHVADVYVDQNLGAEDDDPAVPDGAVRLAGLRFAMLRSEVIGAGPASPDASGETGTPRVLAFFGGTDAFGAAPVLVRALAAAGRPFDATVVASRDDLVRRVGEVPLAAGQQVEVIAPTDRIAALVVGADLVLAASGTSIWELLCLGAAAALVRVADNQVVGYDRTVATGAVAGLGALADVDADPSAAARTLTRLLTDRDERAALRRKGRDLVDGRGRTRVADTLLALLP
ncbi:MAG: spore coat protein [Streptosporangiales bacterium]|nr:spore coat protein [Streptosporangiales bacterium]